MMTDRVEFSQQYLLKCKILLPLIHPLSDIHVSHATGALIEKARSEFIGLVVIDNSVPPKTLAFVHVVDGLCTLTDVEVGDFVNKVADIVALCAIVVPTKVHDSCGELIAVAGRYRRRYDDLHHAIFIGIFRALKTILENEVLRPSLNHDTLVRWVYALLDLFFRFPVIDSQPTTELTKCSLLHAGYVQEFSRLLLWLVRDEIGRKLLESFMTRSHQLLEKRDVSDFLGQVLHEITMKMIPLQSVVNRLRFCVEGITGKPVKAQPSVTV